MFAQLVDEDSHTFKDGALARILKMRKWLLLTAGILFLLDLNVFDIEAFKKLFMVQAINTEWVRFAVSVSAVYQAIILFFVGIQFVALYRKSVAARMGYEGQSVFLPTAIFKSAVHQNDERANELFRRNEADSVRLSAVQMAPLIKEWEEAVAAQTAARQSLKNLRWMDYSLAIPEIATDMVRIVPSIGFFLFALFFHTHLWPIPSLRTTAPPAIVEATSCLAIATHETAAQTPAREIQPETAPN